MFLSACSHRVSVWTVVLFLASTVTYAQTPNPSSPPEPAPSSEEAAPRPIVWDVSQRTRYAGLVNQFRPGLTGNDQALALRTTFRVDVPFRRIAFVGELQDARAYLTDDQSNVSTGLVNVLDVLQAHVRIGGQSATASELLIGRFSMELGSGRLVAQEVYRDVTRTFTGAKLRWRPGRQSQLIAFAVLPVQTRPDDRPALLANELRADREYLNQRFWGALYERTGFWRDLRGEAYSYVLQESDVSGERETRDRHIGTIGGRFFRNTVAGHWDLDVEGAWQLGHAHASIAPSDTRELAVSAHYLHASTGYTFSRRWLPRAAVEYDAGSGDVNPADDRWNRFDALFGNRRVDLGPTSIYGALGRENIRGIGGRLSVAPSPRVDAFAAYRWTGSASATDSFASTGVRDPTGAAGRDGGRQFDARVRIWIVQSRLRVEAGVTYLAAGRFLLEAPNAVREGNTTFFYSDTTYTFSRRR